MAEVERPQKTNTQAIVIAGLVSLVIGVGSGWLINYLTEKRAKLTYDVTTQEVFAGEAINLGIFAIRIANEGKKEVEKLSCHLTFPAGEISEIRITGVPESARTVNSSGTDIEVNLPFLNPGENFSIQLLLSGQICASVKAKQNPWSRTFLK